MFKIIIPNLMIWMNGNEEARHELWIEEQVAEEPSLVGVRNWWEHSPGIDDQNKAGLRFLNVSLDKVNIGVIYCEGEEHGTVIPGYGVLSVYCTTSKDDH